uniref:Uncharacterized protein n=1 Tax=Parascaris equorum TaxID=6256 RepID=A0A914R215_PAREQ
MTSSGTTFCSSGTDESAEATVFVMGDERDLGDSVLEVRTLGPIDEEKEDEISMNMPPAMAPVSVSILYVY